MVTEHCITYLDEGKKEFSNKTYYTIVSVTMKKTDYIQIIEPAWTNLRRQHNIPDDLTLHFTDIRYLLNPGKPAQRYSADLLKVFSKSKSANDTDIDYTAIHAFLSDVVKFIDSHNLIIQATGIKTDKQRVIRNISNRYFKASSYRPPYIAFKSHLNLMAIYLLSLDTGTFQKDRQLYLSTKLRFDGDIDLGERDDLREAYNHCISLGTCHFRPTLTKRIFDEIRFIGKQEVGCQTEITHAGNEIVDFITSIVSRNLWQYDVGLIDITFADLEKIETLSVIQKKIYNSQKIADNYFE